MSSAPREIQTGEDVPQPIELKLPLEVLWQAEEVIRSAEYMLSSSEDQSRIKDTYKKLLQILTPYAVSEKDRTWLFEQGNS
ncbi:MAG: hypothetical protein NT027_06875 [Proteobacteria bacterium]|nr:hypothetical protein [Pseudomonadota bacterium]